MEDVDVQAIVDTDVIIDFLRKRPDPDAVQFFSEVEAGRVRASMTSVTLFELCRGAMLSPEPGRSMEEVEALRSHLDVLPFDGETAEMASEICVSLERRGEPLEIRDIFIGASARARGVQLVTRNLSHFGRMRGVEAASPRELLDRL